jgi:DNA-directed RNA polymerase specialized sigma24 family protein
MSTGEWHLPDRPDAILGSIPEQDLNVTFIAMVHQYSALLNRVARSVTRDASDAEDVLQETFLRSVQIPEAASVIRASFALTIAVRRVRYLKNTRHTVSKSCCLYPAR